MFDDFTKYDNARGASLEDVFGSPEPDEGLSGLEDIMKLLEVAQANPMPTELKDYYPYRLFVGDRYFYPRKGSIRLSTPRDIIFIDELMTDDEEERPAYVTMPLSSVVATTWIYVGDDEDPGNEVTLKAA